MSGKSTHLFLLAASIFVGVAICEAGLRILARSGNARPSAVAGIAGKIPEMRRAINYVQQLAAAPGTDRRWFEEDPPPLPNRSPVSREREQRYHAYEKRGLYGPQADYIWNRKFVESDRCGPNTFFQNYPETVLVFDPPAPTTHPRYRFPPNITTFAGLVTNEVGLRGRPLALAKPPATARIAFLGASTTISAHNFAFSYPDRVVHWLNRFAEANRFDVRFEVLNGGREGLNSEDIARILLDELLPLDPDLAVYYEGSNQFPSANELVDPPIPPRKQIDPNEPIAAHKVPEVIRAHLALGELADRVLNGFSSAGEPRKPSYRLKWPAGVDERNPDPDHPKLPLQLPTIVKDLDAIRSGLERLGSRLVLCSFEWLVPESTQLSPARHRYIYQQLNTVLWPLRYSDIRRLADFQNRVLRRYAAARKIDFLDVAGPTPQDPNLFTDAIHNTDAGERLKAWIVFQQLAPVVKREIEAGRLPHRTDPAKRPPPPSLATAEMSMKCDEVPPGPLVRITGALSLATVRAFPEHKAELHSGPPLEIVTGPQRWSYAAQIPIKMPSGLTGTRFILVRARATSGQIGLGVLDEKGNRFQIEKILQPSTGMTDTYLPLSNPDRADALMIRNVAEGGARSSVLLEDATLVVKP
jgi:hypothetical protein